MAWEDVKDILRPENVHMGIMKVDAEICTHCGLCIENCPFKAWIKGDDNIPRLKDGYACFSCYNCMVACPVNAISIVKPYQVDDGYWVTLPHPLPAKSPLEPQDADGNPDQWNPIERAVFERRSVRNFKDKPVPDTLVRRVLEAGRFAPSAGNCQPWRFFVITNKELIKTMNDISAPGIANIYAMYADDEKVRELEPVVKTSPNMADPRLMRRHGIRCFR